MTAARPPEPREPVPLNEREQQALADIADQLAEDAELAQAMARAGWIPIRLGLPSLLQPVRWRVLAVMVLGLAVVLIPPVWRPVIALLFTMFGIPWLVLILMSREDRT